MGPSPGAFVTRSYGDRVCDATFASGWRGCRSTFNRSYCPFRLSGYICRPFADIPDEFGVAATTKTTKTMKPGIHPENFRLVVFKDMSNDTMFLAKSCTATKDTIKFTDGNEYPLVKIDISHTSHPFYTGKMMLVDTAGRVDKFKKRFAKHIATKDEAPKEASAE